MASWFSCSSATHLLFYCITQVLIIVFYSLVLETEKPSTKQFVLYIKPQLQCLNECVDFGVLLDLSVPKLEDIKLSEQNDLDLCCMKIFTEWLESSNMTTWSTLLEAVDSLNTKNLGLSSKGKHIVQSYA